MTLAGASPASAQTVDEFFDPGTVQELRLTINSKDLRLLRERSADDIYYAADLQWRNIRVRNAGCALAGRREPQPYQARSERRFRSLHRSGQKFLGIKSFVLDNHWQDGSMMHERLAMAFFARMGQPASRESFCRLYINNEFQGLYSIVESVDNAYLARTLGENAGYLLLL